MSTPIGVRYGLSRLDLLFGAGLQGAADFDGAADPDGWGHTGSGSTAIYTYSGTARVLEYTDVTIAAGVTVRPAGCPLHVAGTLSLAADAQVSASGYDASGATGGAASSVVSGAFLGTGSAGRNGVANGTAGLASSAVSAVGMGGRGGAGGTGYRATTNLAGGAAGTVSAYTLASGPPHQCLSFVPYQMMAAGVARGGSGGGSGGCVGATGCTGGGGGGAVVLVAHTLVGDVEIDVSGGEGSAAVKSASAVTGSDGGAGGSFGSIWAFYAEATGTPSATAQGGAGGAGFVGTLGGADGADGTGTDFVYLQRV